MMQIKFSTKPILSCLSLAVMSSVYAAQPVDLRQKNLPQVQKQFSLSLPGLHVKNMQNDSLKFIREHKDINQVRHVRMQQQYAGFDVIGGYAIIHSKSQSNDLLATAKKSAMNGVIYQGLEKDLGQVSQNFVKNKAQALQTFLAAYATKSHTEETVAPVIYIDEQHQAHWAYKVSVLVNHQDKIPERPTAIIDAQSFKPFVKWDNIKTAEKVSVLGKGFGGNQKMQQVTYGSDIFPFLELSRDNETAICYMENTGVKVIDMMHKYSSRGKPMQFYCYEDEHFDGFYWTGYASDGFDRENGAFSPTNDALYDGYVINHMYQDWYNIPALKKSDGSPMQLVMRVHYGNNYENAYWDGKQMTFGDGEDIFYPLVSLGVGAHEISHGFTEQHSDLEYRGQSGGMNEAFSDMAAQAAEFYSLGISSWTIGSEITKEDSGYEALRYMDQPSRDGESIDSADQYYSGIDVHYSSGVFNRLFYLMSTQPGWDTRKAFDVMVKANMDYWTSYSSFLDGGCGVLNATKDLGYSMDDVIDALNKVAINSERCNIEADLG